MKKFLLISILLAAFSFGAAAVAPDEDPDIKWAADLLRPGTPAPDFTLEDLSGRKVSLSDFRGQEVILIFWASWCPDCRAEVGDVRKMISAKGKRAVISISFDRDIETLREFVKENRLGGLQLFDPAGKKDSKVAADFHVRWIPSLYYIDPSGKVILSTVVSGKVLDAIGK